MNLVEYAIISAQKAVLANAEVQRMTVEAQLRNIVQEDGVPASHQQRIKRLIHTLEGVANDTPARKVEVLLDTVAPTLENLG